MQKYDIAIVGLGPAGLSLLYFLKKFRFNGEILGVEAKREVGLNRHCAGLVSSSFIKLMWPIAKETILNKLSSFTVTTLSTSKKVHVKLSEEAYVIDRVMYERILFKNILNYGTYMLGKQVTDIIGNIAYLNSRDKVRSEVFVVAEGYVHRLRRKILGKREKRKKVFGIQEDIIAKPHDISSFTVVFTDTYAKGFFGWAIPLDDKKVRVGIGGLKVSVEMLRIFEEKLVKKNIISKPIKHDKPYGGIILTSPPEKVDHKDNVIFLGDSGFHVKPITGGGLFIHALFSKFLAESITKTNNLKDADFLKEYYRKTLHLRKRLWLQGILAKIIHGLNEVEKTRIIDDISGEEYFLRNYDFHEKDLLSLLTKPSIVKIGVKYFHLVTTILRKMAQ